MKFNFYYWLNIMWGDNIHNGDVSSSAETFYYKTTITAENYFLKYH